MGLPEAFREGGHGSQPMSCRQGSHTRRRRVWGRESKEFSGIPEVLFSPGRIWLAAWRGLRVALVLLGLVVFIGKGGRVVSCRLLKRLLPASPLSREVSLPTTRYEPSPEPAGVSSALGVLP